MNGIDRKQRVHDILTGEIGQGLKQFFGTAGLVLLASVSPVLALAGAPVVMLTDHFIAQKRETNRFRNLRRLFGAELSAISGVPENELTLPKVKQLISENLDDPRYAIFREARSIDLEAESNYRTVSMGFAIGTSLLVAGITAFTSLPPESIATFLGMGTGLLAGAAHKVMAIDVQDHAEHSVVRQINLIHQQAQMQPLVPSKVLGAFVAARPTLQAQIEKQFGRSYEDLNFREKDQLVAIHDATLRLTSLTDQINHGIIRPSELAWIVYDKRSGVPEKPAVTYSKAAATLVRDNIVAEVGEQQEPAERQANFVERYLESKAQQEDRVLH